MAASQGPLAGRRILVTRGEEEGAKAAALIRERGGEPVLFPCLRYEPVRGAQREALRAAVRRLRAGGYDWLACTSSRAVQAVADMLGVASEQVSGKVPGDVPGQVAGQLAGHVAGQVPGQVPGRGPGQAVARPADLPGLVRVACVGRATEEAARALGWPVHVRPSQRARAAELAEAMLAAGRATLPPAAEGPSPSGPPAPTVPLAQAPPAKGPRVLFPCSQLAGHVLEDRLRAAGWQVDRVTAYLTCPAPVSEAAALREELSAGRIDAVTFASPSAVRFFLQALGPGARDLLQECIRQGCVVACIGSTTAQAAAEAGLPAGVVPGESSLEGLLDALAGYWAGQQAT